MKKILVFFLASLCFAPVVAAEQGSRSGLNIKKDRLKQIADSLEKIVEKEKILKIGHEKGYEELLDEASAIFDQLKFVSYGETIFGQDLFTRIKNAGKQIIEKIKAEKKEYEKFQLKLKKQKVKDLKRKILQTEDKFQTAENLRALKQRMGAFLDWLVEEKFVEKIYPGVFADLDKKIFNKKRRGPFAQLKKRYQKRKRDLIEEKINAVDKDFETSKDLVDLSEKAKAFVQWLKSEIVEGVYPGIFKDLDEHYFRDSHRTPFAELRKKYIEERKRKGFSEEDILKKGAAGAPW